MALRVGFGGIRGGIRDDFAKPSEISCFLITAIVIIWRGISEYCTQVVCIYCRFLN